jgi:hypothetical protein
MELDQILNGSPQAEPAPEPMPEPPTPAPAPAETGDPPAPEPQHDRPRDEHGRFAPRAPEAAPQQEPAPPAAARQDLSGVSGSHANRESHAPIPIQALLDERDKRQRAERELEAMRRQYAKPPEPPPAPDMFADPEGFKEHVLQAARAEAEAVRREAQQYRFDTSVALAQQQWPDYAEAEQAFLAVAQANPALGEQMARDPHPAAFAYRLGKQALALREYGPDPAAYREKLVDDDALLQQMLEKRGLSLQQLQQPAPAPQPAPMAFPSSLSTARAAAPRQPTQAYSGPTPLSALGNPALRMT